MSDGTCFLEELIEIWPDHKRRAITANNVDWCQTIPPALTDLATRYHERPIPVPLMRLLFEVAYCMGYMRGQLDYKTVLAASARILVDTPAPYRAEGQP